MIDAHVHLWQPTATSHPWMTGPYAVLRHDATAAQLAALARPAGVSGAVVVQAESNRTETETLLALSARDPFVRWVVGWVDLTARDVDDQLARLRERPGRLIGIRALVHDEPDPQWLDRPDVHAGLDAVARAGLVFDLLVRERELPSAVRVARDLPSLRLVLDHGGKPPIVADRQQPWLGLVESLAACSNVVAKFSGLLTEARPGAVPADLHPWTDALLRLFGPARLMFGSDWPVSTLAGDYLHIVNTALALLSQLNEGEQQQVLSGTACGWYGLTPAGPDDARPLESSARA